MKKPEQLILELCRERNVTLAAAESCTGGAFSARLTQIPNASHYFKGSIVAYSETCKLEILKVSKVTLAKSGAVSEETCLEMLEGLFEVLPAVLVVSITGIAGPGTDDRQTPVGTIYIGILHQLIQNKISKFCKHYVFQGKRHEIIEQAVNQAMKLILEQINEINKNPLLNHS